MRFVNVSAATSSPVPLLAAHRWMQGLDQSALSDFASAATCRTLRPGQTAFMQGAEATHCLFVSRGAIEVLRYTDTGEERVFHRFEAGQFVAEAAMFMGHGRYPMSARAIGPTVVWLVRRQDFKDTCARHPGVALCLLQEFSSRLYARINEVDRFATQTAVQRLAAYLMELPRTAAGHLELPFSQRQLASQLGIRPETLSRIFRDWQERGWIEGSRRCWRLLDKAQIDRLLGCPEPGKPSGSGSST